MLYYNITHVNELVRRASKVNDGTYLGGKSD
jgi:hypothetical protein